MRSPSLGHDHVTAVADRNTTADDGLAVRTDASGEYPDLLQTSLDRVRLEGAVFLRAEYRERWAYESMPGPVTAHFLRPGTSRVVLFHVVASGTCWVATAGGDRYWASAGDVIVLPYGDQHQMGGLENADVVPIGAFMPPPPWSAMPVLRHGEGGSQTDVVCGYLHSEDPLFDPALRALPSIFVVRPTGAAAQWVQANIAYALQQTSPSASVTGGVHARLSELLLIEVLRLHLASAPAAERAGLPRFAIRCSLRRWPRCIGVRSTSGPSQSWRNRRRFRVRCSMRVFVRSSAAPRSGISPIGECTWPRTS